MASTKQFTVWWPQNAYNGQALTIYGVLVAIGGATNGQFWNTNTSALESPVLGNWPYYAIPFTQGTVPTGFCPGEPNVIPYTASFPTANTTAGYYNMQPRLQWGTTPDYQTDQPMPYGSLNQLTLNWNGSDVIPFTTGTGATFLANSLLCQPQNLYDEFGLKNIITWSDLNATGNENTSREWLMCVRSSTFINGYFNAGNRQILESLNDQVTVTRWAATIAGVYLYASRGAEMEQGQMFVMRGGSRLLGNEYGRFQARYDSVLDEMGEYRCGYNVASGGQRTMPWYASSDPIPYPAGDIVAGWGRLP
jgi:hypothetical protein